MHTITKTVKCEAQGSGCMSMRGLGIKQAMKMACEAANTLSKNSLLILAGGGNSLNALGTDCTVQVITESMKNIKYSRKDVRWPKYQN